MAVDLQSALPAPGGRTGGTSSRAVICVRVSPRPAENVRYSPEIQEQKCRDWCDQRGIPVVRVISDILVSGGSSKRFDSILSSLEADRPTHFVVADISRWTRDEPKRYWAMRALIEDGGAKLYSVAEEYLNDDNLPFQATLTTAHVEMAHEERQRIRRKTSEGVRAAWAKGKRWGKIFGWTHTDGQWVIDEPKVRYLYESIANQVPYHQIARTCGIAPSGINRHVKAVSQKDVVGEDLWLRANDVMSRRNRAPRRGARRSSIYRSLLICACGLRMTQQNAWGNYRCGMVNIGGHPGGTVSATKHITPHVRALLERMHVPEDQAEALRIAESPVPEPPPPDPILIQQEMDRASLAWISGRLSQSAYDAKVAELEQKMELPVIVPARPPAEQIEFVRTLKTIDLLDQNPETGDMANRLLRELLHPIRVGPDKKPVEIRVREEYQAWLDA